MAASTKFLVYTGDLDEENKTAEAYASGRDPITDRIAKELNNMTVDRVLDNETVDAFVRDVNYIHDKDQVTATVYKNQNPDKPLHQVKKEGEESNIEKILSENEDAFVRGKLGATAVNNELQILVEKNFGSFFFRSFNGVELEPEYSAEAIQAIQDSVDIGETIIVFSSDVDATASLFEPPEDADIREQKGFKGTDLANTISDIVNLSHAYSISLSISKRKWLDNIDMFEKLIESQFVSTIKIKDTANGIVRIGEGESRSIRENVSSSCSGEEAIVDALEKLGNDS